MEEERPATVICEYHTGEAVERIAVAPTTQDGTFILSSALDHLSLWFWDNRPRHVKSLPFGHATAIEFVPTPHGSFLVSDNEGSVHFVDLKCQVHFLCIP